MVLESEIEKFTNGTGCSWATGLKHFNAEHKDVVFDLDNPKIIDKTEKKTQQTHPP